MSRQLLLMLICGDYRCSKAWVAKSLFNVNAINSHSSPQTYLLKRKKYFKLGCCRKEYYVCTNFDCHVRLCKTHYNSYPTNTVTTIDPDEGSLQQGQNVVGSDDVSDGGDNVDDDEDSEDDGDDE